MEALETDIEYLIQRHFPDINIPLHGVLKRDGTSKADSPPALRSQNNLSHNKGSAKPIARFREVQEFESGLRKKLPEELRAMADAYRLADAHIHSIIDLEFPDYKNLNPKRVKEMVAMTGLGEATSLTSRGKAFSVIEQKRVVEEAEARKAELLRMLPDEIAAIHVKAENERRERESQELRKQCCTMAEAAQIIAEKIFPDDGYDWTIADRANCEAEYGPYLKSSILSGRIPFVNPHTRRPFDYARLSDSRFPHDGLIRKADLYLCLQAKHEGKGYFLGPPKPVSKAPPPIKPIEGRPIDLLYHFIFTKPDWDKWNLLDNVHLWKLACLAVDIEPPKDGADDLWYERQLKEFPARFHSLWEIVNGDQYFSRIPLVNISGRMLYRVDIGWFAAWAIAKGLPVPEPLRKRAEQFDAANKLSAVTITEAQQSITASSEGMLSAAPISRFISEQMPEKTAENSGETQARYPWIPKAQELAIRFYLEAQASGWGTDQKSISEDIAKEFKVANIKSPKDKILSAPTILRHALQPWTIPELAKKQK